MGTPVEDHGARTLRVFSMGNMIEDFVMDRIEEQIKVERQAKFYDKELNFAGHCDGLTDEEVIELKSCHSRDFWNIGVKYSPKLHHRLQLWSYLRGFDREEGRLVYVSKDDMSIKEFAVFRSDKVLEKIVLNELTILNAAWKAKLPPPPIRYDEEGVLHDLKKEDWQYRYGAYGKIIFEQPKYLDLKKLVLL